MTAKTLTEFFDEQENDGADGAALATGDLLAQVAAAGGTVEVEDLAEFPEPLVVGLLHRDANDKRRGPALRAARIGDHRMVWLTSTGWTLAGFPNKREHRPAPSQMRHRMAGRNLSRWVEEQAVRWRPRDLLLTTLTGPALRSYADEQLAHAWAAVKAGVSGSAEVGTLLGGMYPDVVVLESWPGELLPGRPGWWPHGPAATEDRAQIVVAVEVELSPKSATEQKVERHSVAMGNGWWHAVVWVTDDGDVAKRLQRCGLRSDGGSRPGHYLATPDRVGVGAGAGFTGTGTVPTTWWLANQGPA